MTVDAKSNNVELPNCHRTQRRTSFKMTEAALEILLTESKTQPSVALTEMTNYQDRLCDEASRLFFVQSALIVDLEKTRRQFSVYKIRDWDRK